MGAALAATALEAAAEAAAEARPAETAQAALDTESGASGGAGGGNGSSNGEGGGDGAGGAGSGDSSSEGAHPTLRFNLGKQLYYEVPPQLRVEARVQGLDLQELQVRWCGVHPRCCSHVCFGACRVRSRLHLAHICMLQGQSLQVRM